LYAADVELGNDITGLISTHKENRRTRQIYIMRDINKENSLDFGM